MQKRVSKSPLVLSSGPGYSLSRTAPSRVRLQKSRRDCSISTHFGTTSSVAGRDYLRGCGQVDRDGPVQLSGAPASADQAPHFVGTVVAEGQHLGEAEAETCRDRVGPGYSAVAFAPRAPLQVTAPSRQFSSPFTFDTYRCRPRRVRMPRSASSEAIARSDVRPSARMSAITGARSAAKAAAFADAIAMSAAAPFAFPRGLSAPFRFTPRALVTLLFRKIATRWQLPSKLSST